MATRAKSLQISTEPGGTWVQTDRSSHEKWARLAMANPRASSLLHMLIAQMGRNNAVVASQASIARVVGCSVRTLQRALDALKAENWIEVRQVGATGFAYIINSRVVWSGARDGIRYSLFDATVLVSEDEQPDRDELGKQQPLVRIPPLFPGDRQLPSGDGLPPPSDPSLPGMEPDLPSRRRA